VSAKRYLQDAERIMLEEKGTEKMSRRNPGKFRQNPKIFSVLSCGHGKAVTVTEP
jgi:hypothetical protein